MRPRLSGLQWRVVALASLTVFLDGFDIQALGLAIPWLALELGVAPTSFAPAVSATLVGLALGGLFLAPLADRYGRRPLLIAMLLLMGLPTLGAMTATTPAEFASWRFFAGLGLGAAIPVAIAMTAECLPAYNRIALTSMMISCMALGSLAAGLLAPALEARWGWRGIFGCGGVLPLLTALLCLWLLPESRPQAARPAAPAAALPVAALLAAPLRSLTLLLWLLVILNQSVNFSLVSWLPTLLVQADWTPGAAARASALVQIGGIAGGFVWSTIADRGRPVAALASAFLLSGLSLCAGLLVAPSLPVWIVLLTLIGAGTSGALICMAALAPNWYPAPLRATGIGWATGLGRLGSLAGPLLLAAVISAGSAPTLTLSLLGPPMLVCAAAVLLQHRLVSGAQGSRPLTTE